MRKGFDFAVASNGIVCVDFPRMSNTQATAQNNLETLTIPSEQPEQNENLEQSTGNKTAGIRERRIAAAERVKEYRWKPGQSGNPAGRPKKILTDDLSTILRKSAKKRKAIIDALLAGAAKGKIEHIRETFDRVDGPIIKEKSPQQAVQVVILPGGFMEDGPDPVDNSVHAMSTLSTPAVAVRDLPAPAEEGEEE